MTKDEFNALIIGYSRAIADGVIERGFMEIRLGVIVILTDAVKREQILTGEVQRLRAMLRERGVHTDPLVLPEWDAR